MIKLQKKNSKKQARLITFFQTIKEKQITTNLGMQHLKVEVEVAFKALAVSTVRLSLIFSKIFLVTLVVVHREEQVIGGTILDMM